MIFWLQRKWLKIAEAIGDYSSWSNISKLCAVIIALWFLHNLIH